MGKFTLTDLESRVAERAASADPSSYTALLKAKGMPKAAQKLGEEAVETVIAALSADDKALIGEASDLIYHLMVVLNLRNVPFAAIEGELERRTAQSGLEEKARRGAD